MRASRLLVALVWGGAILYVLALSAVRSPARIVLAEDVTALFIWAAATPAILRSARRLPIARPHRLRNFAAHLLLAVAFILALNLIGPVLARLALGAPLDPRRTLRAGLLTFVGLFHLALIVYAFIVGVGHYLMALEARRREELRAERLRADLAEARLWALQLQLQPHFLFNALNSVGSLILTGRGADAFDAVGQLGELLRGVLAVEERQEVSVREEVELAEAYLAIERTRLGERLRAEWEVDPGVGHAQMPPLVLQPLLENAIRHGVARRPEGGRVLVRATRSGDRLRLEVCDDGGHADAPNDVQGGIGLDNTRRRLEHLYGEAQRLELQRAAGSTRVVVELPFHAAAPAAPAGAVA